MRIRILLLMEVMQIGEHRSTDLQGSNLRFTPPMQASTSPRLHAESTKLQNFDIIAYPDPAVHSNE
jgi:hypothetical protein